MYFVFYLLVEGSHPCFAALVVVFLFVSSLARVQV